MTHLEFDDPFRIAARAPVTIVLLAVEMA
jgi:hypothetical protein